MSISSYSSSSTMASTSSTVLRKPDYKSEKPAPDKSMSLEARISQSAIETMELLCKRMYNKGEECLKKASAINTGAFYPNTYYELLQKMREGSSSEKTRGLIAKRLKIMTANGSFYHGTAPKEFFKPIASKESPSGLMPATYALKDSTIRPSEALMAILEDKCLIFIGCGEAIQIAYYKALLDVLGPEKFDYIFAADGPIPFTLGMAYSKNPLLKLTSKLKSEEPLAEGCWVYIGNTKLYGGKHMNGDCPGFNVLYRKKRFFGLGLKSTGETERGLAKTFIDEYNKPPMGNKGLSDELGEAIGSSYTAEQLATFKKLQAHQISSKEYRTTGGGQIYATNTLNFKIVDGLMQFTKEAGRALFA